MSDICNATTRAGSGELGGSFLVELATCKNAESGRAIEWPPAALTVRGSFKGLPQRPSLEPKGDHPRAKLTRLQVREISCKFVDCSSCKFVDCSSCKFVDCSSCKFVDRSSCFNFIASSIQHERLTRCWAATCMSDMLQLVVKIGNSQRGTILVISLLECCQSRRQAEACRTFAMPPRGQPPASSAAASSSNSPPARMQSQGGPSSGRRQRSPSAGALRACHNGRR